VRELEQEIEILDRKKEAAIHEQEFEKAAKFRDKGMELREKLEELRSELSKASEWGDTVVGEEDIAEVVSSWTGIPVIRLEESESRKLLRMEKELHKRVVGQEEAIVSISKAVRRARAGLKDAKRPVGSFIFLGPTGVGKTELAKALSEFLFDDEDALVRLDMSEYMEKHTVSRLVGSPPGYVGYEEGGQLTKAVRRHPYSVVLFDEIEKAHHDVFNILLQIMEDGRLTDNRGRTIDFRHTVLIMTSNAGAELIDKNVSIGFQTKSTERSREADYKNMKSKVMGALHQSFRPEFLNRVDEVIVFHSLTREELQEIVEIQLKRVESELREKDILIDVSDEAKKLLAERGYDPKYGARPLRRVIQKLIEDALAEEVLKGTFGPGDIVFVDAEDGEIVFANRGKLSSVEDCDKEVIHQ